MPQLIVKLRSLVTGSSDEGATMVEYGLIVALIAVVVAVAATLLGTTISTLFSNVTNSL